MSRYKIIIGFAALGFCIGLGFMGLEYVAGHANPQLAERIDTFRSNWGGILCPLSSSFLGLESEDMNLIGFILATLIFAAENAVVYAIAGAVVAQIWLAFRGRKHQAQ